MKLNKLKIFILFICFSNQLIGQYDFNVENAKYLRKEYCLLNPIKIIEVRIQKDSLGNEYEAGTIETNFEIRRVSKYSMSSRNYEYIELYKWEANEQGCKLIRYDSTFYADTINVHCFGGNISNRINHQDTSVLIFDTSGNLLSKMGNINFGGNSYQYDKYNNLILFNAFDYENSIIQTMTWENLYNEKGKILESNVYTNGELSAYFRIFYDDQLEKKLRVSFSNNQLVSLKIIYDFYNSGQQLEKRLEEQSITGIDKTAKIEYVYDEHGNINYEYGS
ncbi:MAG: hypothetical protein ABI851_16675, partial [Saprospiraceae bacterium]